MQTPEGLNALGGSRTAPMSFAGDSESILLQKAEERKLYRRTSEDETLLTRLPPDFLRTEIPAPRTTCGLERFLQLNTPGELVAESECTEDLAKLQWEAVNKHFHEEILSKPLPSQDPQFYSEAYELKVLPLPATMLASLQIKIIVERCEAVEGSMFARKVTLFHLFTKGPGWRVQRKSPDFLWLRTTLETQFPGYCLPLLPSKAADVDEVRYIYCKLLNYLAQHEVFSRSEFFQAFLSEAAHREFAVTQSEARQLIKPDRVEKMQSPSGLLRCLPDFSPDFTSRTLAYLSACESALACVHSQSLSVLSSLQAASNRLLAYANELAALVAVQSLPESAAHRGIYEEVERVVKGWSRYQEEMSGEVRERLKGHFAYRVGELGAVKCLVKERDEVLKRFYKDEKALLTRKQKLWDQWELEEGSISPIAADKSSAFAIMLPSESREVETERHLLAFLNFRVREELDRLLVSGRQLEAKHFTKLARLCDEKSQALSSLWRDATLTLSRYFV